MPLVRRTLVLLAAVFALATTVACDNLPSTLPPDISYFQAPPIYRIWWNRVETCSGQRGTLDSVDFVAVRNKNGSAQEFRYDGEQVEGVYEFGLNRIALASALTLDGPLVRHEMLHALTRKREHSYQQFGWRCADVVRCLSDCFIDATQDAPAVPVDAVPADSLIISVTVSPSAPSVSKYDERVAVVVTVRNPYPYRVVVVDTSSESFRIRYWTSGVVSYGARRVFRTESQRHFAPGETKRAVFDIPTVHFQWYGPGVGWRPEDPVEVRVHALFAGGRWVDSTRFTARP